MVSSLGFASVSHGLDHSMLALGGGCVALGCASPRPGFMERPDPS